MEGHKYEGRNDKKTVVSVWMKKGKEYLQQKIQEQRKLNLNLEHFCHVL